MRIIHLSKEMVLKNINCFILIDQTLQDDPWYAENFLIDLDHKWEYSLAALDNNQIVGFLICSGKGNHLHIHRLAVLPEYQGKKIGTKLVQHLQNSCSKLGMNILTLKVSKRNIKSQNFYKQHGFKEVSSDESRFCYTWSVDIVPSAG